MYRRTWIAAALAVLVVSLLSATLTAMPTNAAEQSRKSQQQCEPTNPPRAGARAADPAAREDAWFAGYATPSVSKRIYAELSHTDTNSDGVVCDWPNYLNTNTFPVGVPENARLFAISVLEYLRERAGKDDVCSAYQNQSTRAPLVESLTANRETVGLDLATASRIVDGSLAEICDSRKGMLTIKTTRVDASTLKFSSCTVLNTIHPAGIASSRSAANAAVANGYLQPRLSRPIYNANQNLDRKNIGVVCPLRPAIPLPSGVSAPAATPTPAAPPAATPAPTPTAQPTRQPEAQNSAGCVTPQEFAEVREGMSVARVAEIFGVSGTIAAESSGFGTTVIIRSYPACTEFGVVSVLFTNGTLTTKSGVF